MERAAESASSANTDEYAGWIRGNASQIEAISTASAAIPSAAPPSPRRRKGGSNRAGSAKGSSAKGDIGIPAAGEPGSPSGSISEPRHTLNDILRQAAEEPEPETPSSILKGIGARFVEARRLNKAESWRQLQSDLMSNIDQLCPLVLPLKDMLTACREIEEFIKGSTGSVGRSNEELLSEFLNGGGPLQVAAGDIASTLDDVEPLDDAITDTNGPNDTNRE